MTLIPEKSYKTGANNQDIGVTTPEQRLRELGIELAAAPSPLGSYVPCVQTGSLLFLSGMLPLQDGQLLHTGSPGEKVSLSNAQWDARQADIDADVPKMYIFDVKASQY